jgi:hypothetical protein
MAQMFGKYIESSNYFLCGKLRRQIIAREAEKPSRPNHPTILCVGNCIDKLSREKRKNRRARCGIVLPFFLFKIH